MPSIGGIIDLVEPEVISHLIELFWSSEPILLVA